GSVDESIRALYEVNADAWRRLDEALAGMSEAESAWRAVPEANSIAMIVRHLRIEAAWHLESLTDGAPMPTVAAPVVQADVDAVPLDVATNLRELITLQGRYLDVLRTSTPAALRAHTKTAYGDAVRSGDRTYFVAYHNAIHLAMHC